MIKVLMLSTDQKILERGSEAQKRMIEYGKIFEELHIVIYTEARSPSRTGKKPRPDRQEALAGQAKIGENISAYSTDTKYRFLYFFDAYRVSRKIIHDSKFTIHNSVITAQDPFEIGLAGWLLKLKYHLSLQLQIHTDIFSLYFRKESFKNRLRVMLAKFLLPRADGIRVVSERIKNSLKLNAKGQLSNVSVLPIFVDARKIKNKKIKTNLHEKYLEYDQIILMASRLTREKNIGIAIKAMQEIVKKYPKTLLLVVGEGPEREALQKSIAKSQLSNVIIEPWTKDLISYYKTADLFLLTSNYEGYGRTAIEAIAAGLPVVMTDVGIAGELLVDDLDVAIVPVDNQQALTGTIMNLLNNKERRDAFIKESEKIVDSLQIKKEEYLDSYKESLEKLVLPQRQRLCYILPSYKDDDSTHFSYLHDFLKEISRDFDIFLIVERGDIPPVNFGYRQAALSRFSIFQIIKARISGYRDFYVHYSFLGAIFASLVARAFGGRVFYWNCGEPWKYRRNFLRELFEDSAYHLVTFLVTGTNSLAERYARYYRIPLEKIKIMPNWINLERVKNYESRIKKEELIKKLNIKKGTRILLFVHRLSKRKGAHYLPEILYRLRNENVVMIIVGDGPERKALNLQFTTYNLQHRVRFLGSLPNYQLPDYYLLADIFLMPSDEEGFPHVLLEAMTIGIPFVAGNVGGVKEIVPKELEEYIVEPGNIQLFADKIKELLLKSSKDLDNLGNLSKEWVKRYDLRQVVKKFSSLIKNG